MKTDKLGMAILIIPLAAAAVSLFFLPQRIPLRFDDTFTPVSYGSKYIILIAGLAPYIIYRSFRRKCGI